MREAGVWPDGGVLGECLARWWVRLRLPTLQKRLRPLGRVSACAPAIHKPRPNPAVGRVSVCAPAIHKPRPNPAVGRVSVCAPAIHKPRPNPAVGRVSVSAPAARFSLSPLYRAPDKRIYTGLKNMLRSPERHFYMDAFLTRTCKGGSPPPPLQSRLPAEIGPQGPIFLAGAKPSTLASALWAGEKNGGCAYAYPPYKRDSGPQGG